MSIERISTVLSEMMRKRREREQEIVSKFNEDHKPLIEWEERFDDGEPYVTSGLFLIGGNYWHGERRKNGYHPSLLRQIPREVIEFLKTTLVPTGN